MSTPNPDCPDCEGTGLIESEPRPPHPPSYDRCPCVLRKDVLANVERGYTGLSKYPVVKTSPLYGLHDTDLWVTSGKGFLAHLRHVAVRQPTTWLFKVVSDAELVTAWLATAGLGGGEIIDPDAYTVSTKYMSIPDLVQPPDLVVVRMGVKAARNQASPEVLAEALNTRRHEGKPTWVWDQPSHPLNAGHLFWSDEVGRILHNFKRIHGRGSTQSTPPAPGGPVEKGARKSLRGGG